MEKINKISFLLFVLLLLFLFSACSSKKENSIGNSIDNLISAIDQEATDMTEMAVYGAYAGDEGYNNLGLLFLATALSDEVHIKNHKDALLSLDTVYPMKEVPLVKNNSALKNLHNAIDFQLHKSAEMYPNYILIAQEEENNIAAQSLEYARAADENTTILLKHALSEIKENGNDHAVSSVWYICSTCGFVYSNIDKIDQCRICGETTGKFRMVK